MVHMKMVYRGEKHCDLTHGPSGILISTDAPKDNHGRGEAFSPTDLLTASLASCILTTMAIHSEKDGVDLKGAHASFTKEMTTSPRRVGHIAIELHLPTKVSPDWQTKFQDIVRTCPVARSLHEDVRVDVSLIYDLGSP